jgi:NAD(P)-dependent dehydrogenase (short-subunit alcohol dehydrogenase family)
MGDELNVFAGGVAVITGAGAGIGAGIARQAARAGMRLVLADIDQQRVETLARELQDHAEVLPVRVDVAKAQELEDLATSVHARFGDVRLLVNNAGVETVGYSWEISAERWDATLDINVHGVIHGVRAFAPRMIAAGQPAWIANLSSVGAFGQLPLQTAYLVSKHAVQAFTECLYLEMEHRGAPIRVSSVIPGMVKTRIFEDAPQDVGEAALAHRQAMVDAMAADGMELDAACERILRRIAAGEFWVSTQPRMTDMIVADRVSFLSERGRPFISPGLKPLFAASSPRAAE